MAFEQEARNNSINCTCCKDTSYYSIEEYRAYGSHKYSQKIANDENMNADLLALKYGRNMEADAVNTFEEVFKERQQNVKVQQLVCFLPGIIHSLVAVQTELLNVLVVGSHALK